MRILADRLIRWLATYTIVVFFTFLVPVALVFGLLYHSVRGWIADKLY